MGQKRKSRDWSWYVGIIFIIFFVLLYFQLIDDQFSYLRGSDNASYILLAKSLASGLGFSDFNLPGNPPHTLYPPLFPLLLSPIVAFFGYNFMWMRLLVIGFALASLYVIRLYFARQTSSVMAYALVLLVGTNVFVFSFSAEILSEIVYLFFSMLALYLFEKNIDRKISGPYVKYLPLLAPLMYFTKFIGITICFAVICVLLLRIKNEIEERGFYIRRLVSFLPLGVIPFILWFLRSNYYAKGITSYQSIMLQTDVYDLAKGSAGIGAIFERAMENISMYIFLIPKIFLAHTDLRIALESPVLRALAVVIIVLILIGFVRELIYKRGIKDFYSLSYFSILVVWPTYGPGDGLRYLIPLVPLLYYYFFKGFELITSLGTFFARGEAGLKAASGSGNRQALLVFLPICIFMILNLTQVSKRIFSPGDIGKNSSSSAILAQNLFKKIERVELENVTLPFFKHFMPCYHNYLKGAEILTRASGPGDIIMTRKPPVVSLISGRRVVKFPYSSDEKIIFAFMEENAVTHILLDNCYGETRKFILPITEKYKEKFTVWVAADGTHSGILRLNMGSTKTKRPAR